LLRLPEASAGRSGSGVDGGPAAGEARPGSNRLPGGVPLEIKDFNAIRISLASPAEIRAWSHGEVTKPETINYRRLRPEKDGLFCEAIFGPTKDWQCYCGKYKKIRYRGIVCDKCGVEVTRSRVRRERMGHIDLASPVAHIWYTRRVPSYLGILLDISRRNLDRVLYFAQYIITRVDREEQARVLKRLEDEHLAAIEALRNAGGEAAQGRRGEIDGALGDLRAEVDRKREEANARLEASTSELMEAASEMQARLRRMTGKPASAEVVFAPLDLCLVAKGETVAVEHHERLNEALQARLSDLQAEVEDVIGEDVARYDAERERLMRGVDSDVAQAETQLDAEIAALESAYRTRRAEVAGLEEMQLLTEGEFWDLKERWGPVFDAGMGAEALFEIVGKMDLAQLAKEMGEEIVYGRSKQRRKKATKRLKVISALRQSGNRPEWMILTVLPVIPPDLRPMVQLDGGRFATSDLNDLYRRVINRNNRLKRLIELGAPDVIIRNEKRMLQEAVDSLIDNSRRGKAVSARGRRKLKSLSDMLKGKQGRFRRNLLGKRVDYSGRSVIVIGPHLKLHQCGLPKGMALELFRPFVMRKLVEYNFAHNVKGAKRLIEKMDTVVWTVLEEIIQDYPVLLNRAPTLHRLGIQAFEPVLVEGNAIQIHPLVCAAFNADFDGDMMAVHVPLSEKAKREARELMLATRNLLKPASGEPIVEPQKDMVLGMYYLTMERPGTPGSGMVFADLDEVQLAYDTGHVHLHAPIRVLTATRYAPGAKRFPDGEQRVELIETTVGRCMFNQVMPDSLRFYDPGVPLGKGEVKTLVAEAYVQLGPDATAELVDQMKDIGFRFATRSGLSIAVDDITVPARKRDIIDSADSRVLEYNQQFRRGLITDEERYVRTIEVWTRATDDLTDAVKVELPAYGPIRTMAASGATKGGFTPIRQLAGMRGLMGDPSGRIIDLPIRSNFREGLSTLEYFISTHGARKGLADTALRTADAGYLTRRLVDVAQDAIINELDCGTALGITVHERREQVFAESLRERLKGRFTQGPVVDPTTGEVIVDGDTMLGVADLDRIEAAGIHSVRVRSPLTCELRHGICQRCYGEDLARGGSVNIGEAVGIIAAQSIGEPGTQLTLRTFHTGGVATGGGGDITQGLPRVQELFEARNPKGEAILSDLAGRVSLLREGEVTTLRVTDVRVIADEYVCPAGATVTVGDGDEVAAGAVLARLEEGEITAEHGGVVEVGDGLVLVRHEVRQEEEYVVPAGARLRVRDGELVEAGQQLTEGAQNPYRILSILGSEAAQTYLLDEIQRVYRSQGVNINDKHIEIIVRQMMGKVRVLRPGDTRYLPGDHVDKAAIDDTNALLAETGRRSASYQPLLMGITKASLETESVLSAASFQHTINILARAAIEGKTDRLIGLKENVIIGKLIPAGTGYRRRTLADYGGVPEGEDERTELEWSEEALAELLEEDTELDRLSLVDGGLEVDGDTDLGDAVPPLASVVRDRDDEVVEDDVDEPDAFEDEEEAEVYDDDLESDIDEDALEDEDVDVVDVEDVDVEDVEVEDVEVEDVEVEDVEIEDVVDEVASDDLDTEDEDLEVGDDLEDVDDVDGAFSDDRNSTEEIDENQ
jgi:DNA-directed RNA polymerase subunit beta'